MQKLCRYPGGRQREELAREFEAFRISATLSFTGNIPTLLRSFASSMARAMWRAALSETCQILTLMAEIDYLVLLLI